jgi:hypothetical protein
MKTTDLIKRLGSKLLGKKGITPVVVQVPAHQKTPAIQILDRLGVIQLHPNWRN